MPIYYRADTRSPEEIFKQGFRSRKAIDTNEILKKPDWFENEIGKNPEWWKIGINRFDIYRIPDAYNDSVICMTSRFNSAPIFPVDNSPEIYVYAISLPEKAVFDFHAYQLREAKHFLVGSEENSGYAAIVLCGFEAFTLMVKPENILAAVKCKRSELLPLTAGLNVYASNECTNFMIPYERTFKVSNKIFVNDCAGINKDAQQLCVDEFKLKANQECATTSVVDALREAGLRKPQATPLLYYYIRSKQPISATKAVLRSSYESLKSIKRSFL